MPHTNNSEHIHAQQGMIFSNVPMIYVYPILIKFSVLEMRTEKEKEKPKNHAHDYVHPAGSSYTPDWRSNLLVGSQISLQAPAKTLLHALN